MRKILETREPEERAILVGVEIRGRGNSWSLEDSLEELSQLAKTAGAEVVGVVSQKLSSPTASFLIGRGKLEEIKELKKRTGANLVIFDDELSPAQQRNLEREIGAKVIDRTILILDIFAKRAKTREGKIQVELAQHQYLLPRLMGMWPHLERLGGGIGTRGPGESQIETDRRLIMRRIQRLKEELEGIRKHRSLYRKRRTKEGIPVLSLIGYTNAGKSTLLNTITKSRVDVEDKLFSTLDPTTRRINLPSGRRVLITDTVGFIQKLPPILVAAFRATLEELEEATLLLHVVDITHPRAYLQGEVVEGILRDLGLIEKPRILIINKVDKLGDEGIIDELYEKEGYRGDVVFISAEKGWGIGRLLEVIDRRIEEISEGYVH